MSIIRKTCYLRGLYMTFQMTTTRITMFCVMISMFYFGYNLTAEKVSFQTTIYMK